MQNLQFIKSLTPDGSSSSLSVTNCFSAHYDTYAVTYHITTDSGSPKDIDLRLISSADAIISNANYNYAYYDMGTSGLTEVQAQGADKFSGLLNATDFPPEGATGIFYVYNPFSSSLHTFVNAQSANRHNGSTNGYKGIGVLKETTSITGINIFLSSTNPTNESNISVYGVL